MNARNIAPVALVLFVGCTPAPSVSHGRFNDSFTLTMQRGSAEILFKTSSPGRFTVTNHRMDHPMGKRPDTEATVVTSAGTFRVTDKDEQKLGVHINDRFFEYLPTSEIVMRTLIVVDEKGDITVTPVKQD